MYTKLYKNKRMCLWQKTVRAYKQEDARSPTMAIEPYYHTLCNGTSDTATMDMLGEYPA